MGKDHELIQAVKLEDVQTVTRIVGKTKAKPKKSGSSKKSPLNFQDEDGFSALHHAALNGNRHILSILLNSQQVNVDIKDNKGMRPLHYAAWQGKIDPVELLLRAGANPSEPSLGGVTPLHLSSQYGSYDVVEALLQYKADPLVEQKDGKSPLDFAAEFGRLRVVERLLGSCQTLLLIDGQSRTRQRLHSPLHSAAKNGHSDVASVLLDHGFDVNMETANGTALHEAALAGKSEVVSLLINSGVDVLKKDSHGQTALDIVNKFTTNRAASDIKTLLRDAIGGSQARAIKDFMRLHDRSALSFKAGDVINVIERNQDGRWKGSIKKGSNECIGFFPRDHVQLIRGPPSGSEGNNYPVTPPPSQQNFPIMPANTYPNTALVSPLADKTNRYSTGSTASASSSGNWSNRESISQTVPSGMRPNHLPVSGVPDPPNSFPPPPPMGTDMYDSKPDEEFPPPPPEMLNHNHSPQGTVRNNSDLRHSPQHRGSPSHTSVHNNFSSHGSPRKINYSTVPPWLAGTKVSDESGVDMSSSNENVERRYHQGNSMIPPFGGTPSIYPSLGFNRPLKLSAAPSKSIDNMMGSREAMSALGPRRPHSDGTSEFRVDSSRPPQFSSLCKGKDADRIYDWLRQQRLAEYTNNFTTAGYDMPTISKMTPEDLTAIGVTKPAHRKRITAMISKMKEPDPLPKFIPGDVVTWLRLLDLNQYYNTLISNDYDTMDKVAEITWEDLQEIGINRLGDQKKFTLAIRRLNYLKKHGRDKLQSPSYPASLNSDSGSVSPAASLEGSNHQFSPPAQYATPQGHKLSSPQSPYQDESHLVVKRRSGLRSSRESLASDASVGSGGSQGSHEHLRQEGAMRSNNPQTINEGIESTYTPAMSSFRMPSRENKKSTSLQSLDDKTGDGHSKGMSFSTFKQPQISPEEASLRYTGRSTESLDRLMAAQAMADRFKRNSIEGGSSIASSGSGSGEQPAVKLKKSLPPAPPKRTNSISSQSKDYEQKTATIGRKKSLKKFREEMQLYRAEMEAEFAAGGFDGQTDRIEGYATIKRTSKKTDPIKRLQRSQSQEGDAFRGITPPLVLPPPMAVVPPPSAYSQGMGNHEDGRNDSFQHSRNREYCMQEGTYTTPQSNSTHVTTNSNVRYDMQQVDLNAGHVPGRPDIREQQIIHSIPGSHIGMQPGVHHGPQVPPFPQAYHPTSQPSGTTQSSDVNENHRPHQYPYPSVPHQNHIPNHPAAMHGGQNGGSTHVDRNIRSDVVKRENIYDVPQVSRTAAPSQMSGRQIHQPTYTSPTSQTSGVTMSIEHHSSGSGGSNYHFVCPPDNKSALPGAQVPIMSTLKNRKSSQDRGPNQSRKVSVSEQSTSSSESGGSNGRRPSSLEMTWKNQTSIEDDTTPVIQPALANPLENIWRPKSRHLVRTASGEKADSSSGSDSGSEVTQIRTDATFLQLKKQFLEQDGQAPVAAFSTLKRQGKKPEPLVGNVNHNRSPGFSDQDEYNQSPVAKHPPTEIPDMRKAQNHVTPAVGSNLLLSQSQTKPQTANRSENGSGSQFQESAKATPPTQRSRREDLQSRVEKIAAGRRDPSPQKGIPAFGSQPLHLHIGDVPPAPEFAAPLPNQKDSPSEISNVNLPPPPPELTGGLPPPPPPPPPPPSSGVVKPKRTFATSINTNNNQSSLRPAGPSSKPPVKLMPDMADLQRELKRRTSKQGGVSMEEAIKKNQDEKRREQTTASQLSPGSPENAPLKLAISPKKPARPPATKKKPVAPPAVKPKSTQMRELPRDDEKDVDIFSQNLDDMELSAGSEDVIESDSSDMESALSGFENENTDTIKKQPSKTNPQRPTLKLSLDKQQLPASKPKVESPGVSWEDDDGDVMGTVKRRPKEEKKITEEEPKRDSLGEAMEKLEALLNSPDSELVMSDFDSVNSTPEKRSNTEEKKTSTSQPSKTVNEETVENQPMSAEDENKVFSDLESMFESLAMDLENMLL